MHHSGHRHIASQPLPRPWRQCFPRAVARAAGLVIVCAASHSAAAAAVGTIKLASWNLEWLLTPADFHRLAPLCTRTGTDAHRGRRALPCDVASTLERSAVDLAVLRGYARQLNADVIALQEVDGPAAARQLFPDYEFCFTRSPALQNTGFAIRRGLPHRCESDLVELSLGEQVRRGARLTLWPESAGELHLLAVHLKSGCARQSASTHGPACSLLQRQGPILSRWIAAQARDGHAFALLGDFNRDLLHEQSEMPVEPGGKYSLWTELNGGDAAAPRLLNASAGTAFHNCVPGQNHRGYIDQILLGGKLATRLVPTSFRHEGYDPADAAHYLLSDHCPVSVRLKL